MQELSLKSRYEEAVTLLRQLISTSSISREEDRTADILDSFFNEKGIKTTRIGNNVICFNKYFSAEKKCILLNSHHDTVKPNNGYTRDPLDASIEEGRLYGLGSNDAGASLVCLIDLFLEFYQKDLPVNILFMGSAEEEISGKGGIELAMSKLDHLDFAIGIIGEPTGMNAAVAEKGLMVLDCYSKGIAGHAARNEGENAIYKALVDIEWFKSYSFPRISKHLGEVNMVVTQIESGNQHNVVPDLCHFVVDVRNTDSYTNQELLDIIKGNVSCEVKPRSTRLSPSFLPEDHVMYTCLMEKGINTFGSPTLSDQALLDFPTVKMGPGQSQRSHTPDEFVYLNEIEEGIAKYSDVLNYFLKKIKPATP